MTTYSEKLKNPKWQKRRLEIFDRDEWMCQICGTEKITLHVHHKYYEKNKEPWEYDEDALVTLCEDCHQMETEYRPEFEQLILKELRKKFFADDLRKLAYGISEFKVFHCESVCSSVIAFFLSNEDLIESANEKYFNSLKNKKNEEEENINLLAECLLN
jgi:hypothetical protein